ncbi:MAG: DEAD/DEAH box helicase [Acholeplasmatales bacterium]|jgi:ATP-dependent RNA helicase DeaD|nr:DEAD/DEAH box helicase [Acholeplasmatales bacterium]
MESFKELNINEVIINTLDELKIQEPTKIQALAIPIVQSGKDIIAQAKTGTGKTFAYLIPILEKIDINDKHIQALIICPTRELANQVSGEIIKLSKYLKGVKHASIYGGESYTKQFRELDAKPQLVVSTPGRILDHIDRKTVDIQYIKFLVLDEADEMLKMGFKEDLENIVKITPTIKQTLLFSATIPPFIKKIALDYQHDPVYVSAENNDMNVTKIKQFYFDVKKKDKLNLLVRLIDLYQFNSAIIFANTKLEVDEICEFLNKQKISAKALHGDLKQKERDDVMRSFKRNVMKILVASDVAARGLDIEGVDAIINYELPFESELYIHRIGRTGRAGKKGSSFSLVAPSEKSRLKNIVNLYKSEIILKDIPNVENLNQVIALKNKVLLDEKISSDNIKNLDLAKSLLEKYSPEQIISALINDVVIEYREYPEIEEVRATRTNVVSREGRWSKDKIAPRENRKYDSYKNKSPREESDFSQKKRVFKKEFYLVEINVGEESLNKTSFLEFLDKQVDVFNRHIGIIKMNKNKTSFEIEKDYLPQLMKANGKNFFSRKIIINKLEN